LGILINLINITIIIIIGSSKWLGLMKNKSE